jgi:hypothetical protein
MTGFMDEPDEGDRGGGGGDQDVEREQPPRNRRYTDRKPHRPRSDDERIDEASDESFPASDPPQQP